MIDHRLAFFYKRVANLSSWNRGGGGIMDQPSQFPFAKQFVVFSFAAMAFNKIHATIVFSLLATAFFGVVVGKGRKGVRTQTNPFSSSPRRLSNDKEKDKVKGPSKRDCELCKSQLSHQCTSVFLEIIIADLCLFAPF
jgi:hypothetical protein